MAMTAEAMLRVRAALYAEYDEAFEILSEFGPDEADDRGGAEWPYETFFRFEEDWQHQGIASELTWRQWYRILLDWDGMWCFDEFNDTQRHEWEIALGLNDEEPEIVAFIEYIEPVEASFTSDRFWSLQRWCKACRVKLAEAHRVLEEDTSLAIDARDRRQQ